MKTIKLKPQFVESVPERLEFGVLYVSMTYATAIHRCACGCGMEVVPTDWKLYFDGENVTLEPSIGNWSFPCRSHYWIRGGKVRWAGEMTRRAIDEGRTHDRFRKAAQYGIPIVSEKSSPAREASNIARVEVKPRKLLLSARISSWWESWKRGGARR